MQRGGIGSCTWRRRVYKICGRDRLETVCAVGKKAIKGVGAGFLGESAGSIGEEAFKGVGFGPVEGDDVNGCGVSPTRMSVGFIRGRW
jgi:hypothetical protein